MIASNAIANAMPIGSGTGPCVLRSGSRPGAVVVTCPREPIRAPVCN